MRLIRSLLILSLLLASTPASGQSLLDRPPNLTGDWAGAPGTLYFHFLHRFTASDAPERKVSNVPTFMLAAGLPKQLLAGFNYSTNSTLTPGFPNEWELFARWAPLSQDLGAPLDLGAQVGYNNAAEGIDGEVSAARKLGIARALLAGRVLSDPFEAGNTRFAVGGGVVIHFGNYLSLAGDITSLTDRDSAENVAWGAGLHIAIPLTPHTLSLQITNTLVGTLQGASRGSDNVRYGFEFTIPLTLRRYFGNRAELPSDTAVSTARAPSPSSVPAPVPATTEQPAPAAPARTPAGTARPAQERQPAARPVPRVVRTTIKNISYLQPRLQVAVGTTIEWTNSDPLQHTVTALDGSFNSGLINPGKTFRHTFTRAGTYNFNCIPHPFMKGVIIVRAL